MQTHIDVGSKGKWGRRHQGLDKYGIASVGIHLDRFNLRLLALFPLIVRFLPNSNCEVTPRPYRPRAIALGLSELLGHLFDEEVAFDMPNTRVGLKLVAARIGSPYIKTAKRRRQGAMNWTMSYHTFRFLVWLGYAGVVFLLIRLTHRLEK